MVEIAIPAAEGVLTAAGSDVLLQLGEVVEAETVLEESRAEMQTLGGLEVGGLVGQTGSGRIVEERCPTEGMEESLPGRTAGEAAVELGGHGKPRLAECSRERNGGACSGDVFREAVGCVGERCGVGAEAVVVDTSERDALRVEVEQRGDAVMRSSREPVSLNVTAGTPRSVQGGLRIDVVGGSPLVGEVFVLDECETKG